jgi:cyclopropane fatty-acyl-phospholipid synthase-like methyltransferase
MVNKQAVNFYELIDSWTGQGIEDFTEGMYNGNPSREYFEAQRAQHDYLLNQVNCSHGSRILDVGCGNGGLLQAAEERMSEAEGVTISPVQVKKCRAKGLNVFHRDYVTIGDEWKGKYSGLVANGSLEHFVTPRDAFEGDKTTYIVICFKYFLMFWKREQE